MTCMQANIILLEGNKCTFFCLTKVVLTTRDNALTFYSFFYYQNQFSLVKTIDFQNLAA